MTVTEIPLRLEPVTDDPFISSLATGAFEARPLVDRRQPAFRRRAPQRVGRRRDHGIRTPVR